MNDRATKVIPSTHGSNDATSPGPGSGGDSLRGAAGHLSECPCCGGPARVHGWPDHAAVRRAVSSPPCPCSACTEAAAAAASDRVSGAIVERGDASCNAGHPAIVVEPPGGWALSALPVRREGSERLPGEMEALPRPQAVTVPAGRGLGARWGRLVAFGMGGGYQVGVVDFGRWAVAQVLWFPGWLADEVFHWLTEFEIVVCGMDATGWLPNRVYEVLNWPAWPFSKLAALVYPWELPDGWHFWEDDRTDVVEPWERRLCRSVAFSLGVWGLATELRLRRYLQLAAPLPGLCISPVDNPAQQPIHRRAFTRDRCRVGPR